MVTRYKRAKISYKRLDKLYQLEPEKVNERNTLSEGALEGKIEIRDLSFSYPGQEKEALKNINLEISKEQTIRNNWDDWKRKDNPYESNYTPL